MQEINATNARPNGDEVGDHICLSSTLSRIISKTKELRAAISLSLYPSIRGIDAYAEDFLI